jgi:sulfite exporter TauE/SafE
MMDFPLFFLGGLLGSSHCVGMCGALALSVGLGATTVRANLVRQSIYTLGRLTTYSFLGAAVGFAGWRLSRQTAVALNLQGGLALVSGVLLIWQGLRATGILPRRGVRQTAGGFCPAQGVLATFLTAPGWHSAFLAGLLTGFLPCGLVYAYLVLAASTESLFQGALGMAIFGAGTGPLMMLTGAGASVLGLAARRHLLRAAAWCVVLTGLLTIHRGVEVVRASEAGTAVRCPYCETLPELRCSDADRRELVD